ncbi:hypothetical protein [Cronobacter condimenti]|uniref:hypothetical protein n=1 Tax=Cronobacter condimenti TaxID=1163710 RepID=UPI000A91F982|nr:hypothetical protein [Cronobacter condimenti]
MKTSLKLTSIFCALLLSIFHALASEVSPGRRKLKDSPESVVQHFYTDYLTAWNDPDVGHGLEKIHNAIGSFTTKHLQKLKSEDGSGTDYFTNVQDIFPEWVDEIFINVSSLRSDKTVKELMLGHSEN